MKKLKKRTVIILSAVILLALIFMTVGFVTDIMEFKEAGSDVVFIRNLEVNIVIKAICMALIFAVFYANNFALSKIMTGNGSRMSLVNNRKTILILSTVAAVIIGYIMGGTLSSSFMQYANSVSFGKADPIFGNDIGYYVFQRPFLSSVCGWASGFLLFQIIYLIVVYALTYAERSIDDFKDIFSDTKVAWHVLINVIIYFAANIIAYKFKKEGILFGEFGGLFGAGFVDINIWLNYYKFIPVILGIVVIALIVLLLRKKIKGVIITVLVIPAIWILTGITALIVQAVWVTPYEVSMEKPYMEYNIEATLDAYGLSDVKSIEYPATNDLTLSDIEENSDIIDNIRITDLNQNLVATNSIQSLRSFYTFKDNDIIPYDINGDSTALCIAVRELDFSKLQDSAKSYINRHLRYTHGYGAVINPMNAITGEGQPEYIVKNIPTLTEEGAPVILQPRIYYGEMTDEYAIVGGDYSELDYMEGDRNIEYKYSGEGGIQLTPINRLMYAIKEGDIMLVISGYINSGSKLLVNRNILERAKMIAPFLEFDDDPYAVVDNSGKIKWVIDAYTTTKNYPYAQSHNDYNYMRNSVKAVVDAYDGTVKLYITDKNEPIAAMYDKLYPGLFETGGLPESIASHIRYSEQLFKTQSEIYKKYHVSNAEALYSNSDAWVTAKEIYDKGEPVDVEPYYNMMSLSGVSGEEELVLMQPYTPQGKENLVSWLAARQTSEGGRLVIYTFPKGKTVYGTLHIENKIDNDPDISKELTLWGQGGSTVLKGNLLVIPVKNSLLYVEPIYITTTNSAALPEVKRIVVAYNDRVVMMPTLKEGLAAIFGVSVSAPQNEEATREDEESIEMLIDRAVSQYEKAESYSKEGNFEAFGNQLDNLGDTLSKIKEKNGGLSE